MSESRKVVTQRKWRADNPDLQREYQDRQNKKRREARALKNKKKGK